MIIIIYQMHDFINIGLTFITLWANSADDKLVMVPRKQDLTFHANCLHNLHEMSKPVFWEK